MQRFHFTDTDKLEVFDKSHSALLNNGAVYGLLEYADNMIIASLYPVSYLIIENWTATRSITESSNNNIQQF